MMPKEKLRKADIIASVCFIGLGASVIAGGLRMPIGGSYGGVENAWYVSPAVLPLLLGTLLIVCALSVLARAIKEGGHRGFFRFFAGKFRTLPANAEVHRIWMILLILGTFIFLLLGRLDFYVAGMLFLATFMLLFYRPRSGRLERQHVLLILGLSVVLPLITGYTFSKYLLVPLP